MRFRRLCCRNYPRTLIAACIRNRYSRRPGWYANECTYARCVSNPNKSRYKGIEYSPVRIEGWREPAVSAENDVGAVIYCYAKGVFTSRKIEQSMFTTLMLNALHWSWII
jgi:hypothetical protein